MDMNPLSNVSIGLAGLVNMLLILGFWIAVGAIVVVVIHYFSRRR